MFRVVVTVLVPLLLPTALYLAWVWAAQSLHGRAGGPPDRVRWAALPWPWLAGAGAVLVALVLAFVTIGFGTAQNGAYVPPRWEHGHIVPGHIDAGRQP